MPVKNRGQVFLRNLHPALRKIKPNIVHLHGLWFLPTLQVMARRPRSPLVADDHADNGNLPKGPGNLIRFGLARWVCRSLYRNGGKILSVNPFSLRFVTRVLHTPPDGVHFLPLGINTHTFYPDYEKRAEGRKRLQLPADACVFLTSGRLTPGKGFELLLQSFAGIHRTHRNTRLIMIGSGTGGPTRPNLRRLAAGLNLEGASIFLPWMSQSDLNTYYNAADVGVLPGKLGGIREILAVGRPLIVPDHLATRYFVEDGNGLKFSSGDQASLSGSMSRYIDFPDLRRQHGLKSLEAALGHLSWQAIASESLEVYQGLLKSTSGGKDSYAPKENGIS